MACWQLSRGTPTASLRAALQVWHTSSTSYVTSAFCYACRGTSVLHRVDFWCRAFAHRYWLGLCCCVSRVIVFCTSVGDTADRFCAGATGSLDVLASARSDSPSHSGHGPVCSHSISHPGDMKRKNCYQTSHQLLLASRSMHVLHCPGKAFTSLYL